MKKFLLSLFVISVTTLVHAQLVKGDMNDDLSLTMQDANAIVNVFVNGEKPTTLSVVPLADYEALEKEITALREELNRLKYSTNGHWHVDLGLSVKWATCNVGASSPEKYGDYFAWGETTPKDTYNWSTYKWCNGSNSTLTKYCAVSDSGIMDNKTILDPEDDAATANWGAPWRMPTKAELEELMTECTWDRTKMNGVDGFMVTGKNGNHIFLPATGYFYDSSIGAAGENGFYWSSELDAGYLACYLYFFSTYVSWGASRSSGRSVRPVCPK